MKRANGFAMTEALVAIGIGALIMTTMIYLQTGPGVTLKEARSPLDL